MLVGKERALLFDSGPGIKNIKEVVSYLTPLPVMVVPSHLHYDHTGNLKHFTEIGLSSQLCHQASRDNRFYASKNQHLGYIEGFGFDEVKISQWIENGSRIDLGGRTLEFMDAPGHTPDSLILIEPKKDRIFSGDFIYPGMLVNLLPGANLNQSLETLETLLQRFNSKELKIFGAHRQKSSDPSVKPLQIQSLENYRKFLLDLKKGSISPMNRIYPSFYRIDEQMQMIGDLPFALRKEIGRYS